MLFYISQNAMKNKDEFIVLCIPVSLLPFPPNGQQNCKIYPCPVCKKEMWVNQKKREFVKVRINKAKLICMRCHVEYCVTNSIPFQEPIDLIDFEKH
jgi:uncharacterized protein YbaR (Trm112 family)